MLDGAEPGREERIAALCTEQPEPSTALTCASQGADSSRTKTFHRGENTFPFSLHRGAFCTGKTSTGDENSLDIVTRPTKRLWHLRQIPHLRHMEMRGKRPLSVPLARLSCRRGQPQNTRCGKQRATGNHRASIIAGAQNKPPSAPRGQRGPGPCCRSCWDTSQKAFVRAPRDTGTRSRAGM